jgi:hypothetical protein
LVGCRFFQTYKGNKMNALQGTQVVLGSVANAAATTPRTALFDTLNASSCKLLVATSAANSTSTESVTVAVTSGSNGASTTGYTSVGSSAVTGTVAGVRVVDIDMRGKDRYLYVTATPGVAGTTDQVAVGSIVAVMEMGLAPTNSTTQLGNAVL